MRDFEVFKFVKALLMRIVHIWDLFSSHEEEIHSEKTQLCSGFSIPKSTKNCFIHPCACHKIETLL